MKTYTKAEAVAWLRQFGYLAAKQVGPADGGVKPLPTIRQVQGTLTTLAGKVTLDLDVA